MDLNEAKARVDRLGDMLDLARAAVRIRRHALDTADEEERRLTTLCRAAVDQRDAAIRAACEEPTS